MNKYKVLTIRSMGIFLGLIVMDSTLNAQNAPYTQYYSEISESNSQPISPRDSQTKQSFDDSEFKNTSPSLYSELNSRSKEQSTLRGQGPSVVDKQQQEIQRQKQQVEDQVKKNIVPEAVAVIEEIKNAIMLIRNGKNNEATASIEKATGKIDILLSRQPKTALLPIDFDIDVIDDAPFSLDRIEDIGGDIYTAIKNKDYPTARLLLEDLRSEINIETYSIPLGAYPDALKRAANLIEHKAYREATALLQETLTSLVVIDQTIPIPIINARTFLAAAEEKFGENRDQSSQLVDDAINELERARDLGYISKSDEEYASLRDSIKDLQQQIKNNDKNPSKFAALKERLSGFLKRHFEKKKTISASQNKESKS